MLVLSPSIVFANISRFVPDLATTSRLYYFLILMVVLSVLFFVLFLIYLRLHWWVTVQDDQASKAFRDDRTIRDSCAYMQDGNPYRNMVEHLLSAFKEHGSVASQIDLNDWIMNNIESQKSAMMPHIVYSTRLLKAVVLLFVACSVFFALYDIIQSINVLEVDKALPLNAYLSALYGAIVGLSLACVAYLCILYLEHLNQRNLRLYTLFGHQMHALFMTTADRIEYAPSKYMMRLGVHHLRKQLPKS